MVDAVQGGPQTVVTSMPQGAVNHSEPLISLVGSIRVFNHSNTQVTGKRYYFLSALSPWLIDGDGVQ